VQQLIGARFFRREALFTDLSVSADRQGNKWQQFGRAAGGKERMRKKNQQIFNGSEL
jgi:hypothetical protein